MTSNMKLLLAASSAKSFVSAEGKKEMGGWWSCHHFDAQVHLSSPLKPVEIEAACHLPLRKSNQRRLPIKPISTDEMEADSLLFCFALTATRRPPLSLHRGVFVCHSTFSRWVRCDLSSVSVIHSTPTPPPLSLWTPSITCPSERVAWQWCDGATQTVKMDCYLGRLARTHAHTMDVWHTNTQAESHVRAFTHIRNTQSHTCMTVQSRILPHTCTVQWTPGPVSRRSLNLTQCSTWKQAKGGIMLPLHPRWLETHTRTWAISYLSHILI